jgi:membrane-bound serine protease (ClpP class)
MKARFFRLFSAVLFLAGFAGMILSFTVADHPAYAESKKKTGNVIKVEQKVDDGSGKSDGASSEKLSDYDDGEARERLVYVIKVTGIIGPVVHDHIKRNVEQAGAANAEALILEMHTPGGLLTSTRDITQTILASKVPVVTYVSPPGSHAASAGTYILYSSHVAAMAPGTNIGAATPISISGEGPVDNPQEQEDGDKKGLKKKTAPTQKPQESSNDALAHKAMNDATAYIRGLAELRGRNVEWAEKAVRQAATLTASEAIEENVIEIVAENVEDLVEQMDGRVVKMQDTGDRTLRTKNAKIIEKETNWRTQILMIITDPNVAFLLMTLGGYGLIYEFANPGTFVPGVIGVICIVLGLFAMNVMPVNYAGVALLLLGMGFMAGEALVPSFGVLGIGGAISFALGATILYEPELTGYGLSWWTIATATGASFLLLTVVLAFAMKGQRNPVTTGEEGLLNSKGEVLKWANGRGDVRVMGEIWQAVPAESRSFRKGDMVKIVKIDGLKLIIAPQEDNDE